MIASLRQTPVLRTLCSGVLFVLLETVAAPLCSAAEPIDNPPATAQPSSAPTNLDFDLLGAPSVPQPLVDDRLVQIRRTMLVTHQTLGIALFAMMLGTVVVGQLNYLDKFDGPSSGRYELPHEILAYTTFGTFAATGLLAVFAPTPIAKTNEGFDRLSLHKFSMYGAAIGMLTEVILGAVTAGREGYTNQANLARVHLGLGYTTLGFMSVGVGAIVF